MEKKRGQHYVWRYYLTSWTNDTGNLFCLRKNKIFPVNPRNIGKARDFYRLRDLDYKEISTIEKAFIMDYWPKEIQQLNRNWVNMFTEVFRIKNHLEKVGKMNAEAESELDVFINNSAEDFHSRIEDAAFPHLNSLKVGNMEFYKNEDDRFNFIFFLCMQYFRTNKMKNNVLRSFEEGSIPISPILIENVWSVLYFIFATNMYLTLAAKDEKFKLMFLRNASHVPIITGDQPVINTHADYSIYDETSEFELYYPISPSISLLITSSNKYNGNQSVCEITEDEVNRYNTLIFKASEEQVYANNEAILQRFVT